MISQVTVEAHHSATYVENYLDSVENLPDDVQRHLSRIREIDVLYRNHLRDVSVYYDQWSSMNGSPGQLNGGGAGSDSSQPSTIEPSNASRRVMARIQQGLIAAQELGDEKLQIVQLLQDLIDHKTRQLDQDFKNLGSDFFSRLDYNREEKLTEGQQKEIRANSPGSACSPNNVNSSPAAFSVATGNGQSSTSGSNGGNGTVANSGNGSFTANSGTNENGNNGTGSGGSTTGTGGNGGSGAGSGITNTATAERGSKRARRTRNEQNSGSANGSSTPNSNSGAHIPMDIDPIDTSNVKQEVSSSSGVGQASGSGTTGSGTTGKANSSGQASGGGGGGGGQGKKGGAGSGKKKKRKTGRGQAREAREDTPPPEETIDPDEPTYCLCDQISFGEMILCDNDLCPIEWFHFSCVALMSKPKGKWFCPNCRGDRPNVMKPKAQFLKELERYNKEKEEKT
ncbi:inhibitor of growth protein 1 [Topomyia yanbarensis]|uniref:inhibitor of growth protein 1 n=1 Tax=Topomyia yanbarensis TaxID=2498891 RepID=UPI00273AA776|nr:inhibitor of growth protein 1 [Topomyia yanbarensis]